MRATTTQRDLPTWVKLTREDPFTGFVNTDNIETLGRDELGDSLGACARNPCWPSTGRWP